MIDPLNRVSTDDASGTKPGSNVTPLIASGAGALSYLRSNVNASDRSAPIFDVHCACALIRLSPATPTWPVGESTPATFVSNSSDASYALSSLALPLNPRNARAEWMNTPSPGATTFSYDRS